MTTERNKNYKLKYRPNYRAQLSKYTIPPPMTGNPPEAAQTSDWGKRCQIVYEHMIAVKNGIVPTFSRQGLWHHSVP